MNGRRRPKREVERSLSSPIAGWTSMAMISPAVRISPRAVFLMPAGAKSATRNGMKYTPTALLRMFRPSQNRLMLIWSYQRTGLIGEAIAVIGFG